MSDVYKGILSQKSFLDSPPRNILDTKRPNKKLAFRQVFRKYF